MKNRSGYISLVIIAGILVSAVVETPLQSASQNAALSESTKKTAIANENFYPPWASAARYLRPLAVIDTDSALGRRNLHPKLISLKDMARMHGHLCDGLVTSWVELEVALRELFPEGAVDRTDVRAISKNGPCSADAAAWMTGARLNQGTLMLDNSIGNDFIVQRLSTGKAVRVSPRSGVYPAWLSELETSIRSRRSRGEAVTAADIDRFEEGADAYSLKLLDTPPERSIKLERLADFTFPDHSLNPLAPRSDIIDRDAPRGGDSHHGETKQQ